MCPVGFLQQFETNGLDRGLDLLYSRGVFLLKLDVPLRTHKGSKSLITGDIDGKIRVKVDKLILSDVSFRSNRNKIQKLLQDDILILIS